MSDDTTLTVRGLPGIMEVLNNMPAALVAKGFVRAGAAFNDKIYDALLAATPEQEDNKDGGRFGESGSLKADLDSSVELDSDIRGVRATVGFKKQGAIALLVDRGHQMVTHDGRVVGSVVPHPFLRQTWDGGAVDEGITAAIETLEEEFPGVKP